MDVILILVVCGCALAGLFMGAVRMASAAAAVIGATLAGRWAGPPAAQLLAGSGEPGQATRAVGVALVAVAAAVIVLVAGRGLRKGLQALHLGWLDRLGGGVLAGAAAVVLTALLLALAEAGGWEPSSPWAARLAERGRTALALHQRSTPASSASPSSTPATATSSGQQPE